MADEDDGAERTEDPTQKRLDDALERGDVAKSQEVNTWFMIAGAALVLSSFSGSIGGIQMPLRNLIANSWIIHTDGPSLLELARSLEYMLIAALGVPLLLLALAAIAGNMLQHRLVWSGESLKPKFSKISPASGAKRIFGKQALDHFQTERHRGADQLRIFVGSKGRARSGECVAKLIDRVSLY